MCALVAEFSSQMRDTRYLLSVTGVYPNGDVLSNFHSTIQLPREDKLFTILEARHEKRVSFLLALQHTMRQTLLLTFVMLERNTNVSFSSLSPLCVGNDSSYLAVQVIMTSAVMLIALYFLSASKKK